MLASPLLLGLVLMVDPWARNVDFSGGVVMELRGGSAPLVGGQPAEPALRTTIAPDASLIYQSRVRGRQVVVSYAPQMYMRISQQYFENSLVRRPLFFHTLSARYAADLSTNWGWDATLAGGLGEQDYSLQSAQLGNSDGGDGGQQGTLVGNPVITTGSLAGALGFTGAVRPLHTVSIAPSFTLQRLLSDPPSTGGDGPVLSLSQTSGRLALSHAWQFSQVDTLTSSISGGYADFDASGSQAFSSVSTAWRRRLRPRLDNEISGGVFFTSQVRDPGNAGQGVGASGSLPALPTVTYLLAGRLFQRSRLRISSDFNIGTSAYFDPVQGSVLPLVGGGGGLSFFMPPDWTAGVTGTFFTPPTRPTDAERSQANNPASARTSLSVRTPVSYDLSRNYKIEFGTITSARGPHLGVRGTQGRFPQTEFWLYVSFQLRYSTSRAEGRQSGGSTISG